MNRIPTGLDRCVCCGRYVPEGRQVCTECENAAQRECEHKPLPSWRQVWHIIKAKLFGGLR